MTGRSSPYAVLFEPVRIGPVTAPNRFYQVPHCNGMGHRHPRRHAAMRGIKAEGGWGVVCTEETEIHPTSEISPSIEGRLWDDGDIAGLRLMTEAVHEHGALAGIELVHNGLHAPNNEARLPPMAPSATPVDTCDPVHARAMDRSDIRALRRWHRDAAIRARKAGFDIVYAYAGHGMSTLMHFMQRRHNSRSDEYGGSLENRVRLTREVIAEMKDAVGDVCAIALRCSVDELLGADGISADGEGHDIVAALAEEPDLWDVNVSGWGNDSVTARFEPIEGYQDRCTAFVKGLTSKPVVGVGRFTSPDAMAARVSMGVLDLIGAARPSIADPFLPNKIAEDRIEEIRECIGCNICVAGDFLGAPIRCTQNPTMGEEWRRRWHPERIGPKASDDPVLVVGGGPAGLECALQLALRGYPVQLAEATDELGGRLVAESRLPGLASYIRVRDYRSYRLSQLGNVDVFFESRMDAETVVELASPHVIVATGSAWRRDGTGRRHHRPVPGFDAAGVFTPDDILGGRLPGGRVLVYDDDHYLMGGVLAELLASSGCSVHLVTPAPLVSQWTVNTLEQPRIQRRLLELGVTVDANRDIAGAGSGRARLVCVFTGRETETAFDSIVTVTAREPVDGLARDLKGAQASGALKSMTVIGDALAPGTVAAAVYTAHLAARNLEGPAWDDDLFRRDHPVAGAPEGTAS